MEWSCCGVLSHRTSCHDSGNWPYTSNPWGPSWQWTDSEWISDDCKNSQLPLRRSARWVRGSRIHARESTSAHDNRYTSRWVRSNRQWRRGTSTQYSSVHGNSFSSQESGRARQRWYRSWERIGASWWLQDGDYSGGISRNWSMCPMQLQHQARREQRGLASVHQVSSRRHAGRWRSIQQWEQDR